MADFTYVVNVINSLLVLLFLFFGLDIAFIFNKIDYNLLKARLFLGKKVLRNMWIYSSIAGGAFVLHQVLWALEVFQKSNTRPFLELTLTLFTLSFLLLTYEWYLLIKASVKRG
ncbi:MAG: hypothetical protein V3R82_06825 [Candidatus Hydrothermarchaeales archaeon]